MSQFGGGFRPSRAPVEEGKVYDAKIEDLGREGDGLARIENFVVFIPGTKVGDQVKVRITKVLRRMAFGEVVEE
jgi:predicted RNA-binding protein with TRAM domain